MKNNNKVHENIPGMKCNKVHESIPGVPCGIALMPMKEVYQQMQSDVTLAINALSTANNSRSIRNILQEIFVYQVDNRVSEHIQNRVAAIKRNVRAMHTNDYTRFDMCNNLSLLVSELQDAIEEEERNEAVEDVRCLFLLMADHAEEFVNWIEEMHKKQ
mgnify:CR=1 FL=1